MKTTPYTQVKLTDITSLDHGGSATEGRVTDELVESLIEADRPYVVYFEHTATDVEELVDMSLALSRLIQKALGPNDPAVLIDKAAAVLHQAYILGSLNDIPEIVVEFAFHETPIAWSMDIKAETTMGVATTVRLHEDAFLSKY